MPSNTTLPPFRFLLFLLYDVGHVAVADSFKLEVFFTFIRLTCRREATWTAGTRREHGTTAFRAERMAPTLICNNRILLLGSEEFCRQNAIFLSSKVLPQIPNFSSFSSSENEALSAVYNSLMLLTYSMRACENSSRHLACTFLRKKHDCWILSILNSCSFCLKSHYKLTTHLMLFPDLHTICNFYKIIHF